MSYLLLFIFGFLFGCAHVPAPILPPHIKSVEVVPFVNRTIRYQIEQILTENVIEELILDGRLKVGDGADARLQGEVLSFSVEPLIYDEHGNVLEYRMWMQIKIEFFDIVEKKKLWEDVIEGALNFSPDEPQFASYEDAEEHTLEELVEQLSKAVLVKITEGW
jgi:hypothetical protein